MRIINIASALTLLLYSFKGSSTTIIKGAESVPEINQDSRIGETPDVTNVRAKNPLSDVAKPQLPAATVSHASTKRCVIPDETVGSPLGEAPLSLTRRDLTDIRKQQCENCRNRTLCKKRKTCSHCKVFCDNLVPEEQDTENNIPTLPAQEEKRELPEPEVDNNIVLEARLQETVENVPRYYSLGSVGQGPMMRLLAKVFKSPETYEKYILLGVKNGRGLGQNMNDILIIDLVQAFGEQKNTPASVYQFDSEKASSLAELFNEKFDEALFKKFRETMGEKLTKEETDKIIAEVMDEITGKMAPRNDVASPTGTIMETAPPRIGEAKEAAFETAPRSGNVAAPQEATTQTPPETETRCSDADEAIEQILDNIPSYTGYQPSYQGEDLKHKLKNKKKPQEEEEVVYNPVVIQDGYDQGKERSSADRVDDNKVVGEPEATNVEPEPKPTPESENQINEPQKDQEPVTIPRSSIQELEKNVIKVVEDSLKAAEVPTLEDNLREVPEIVESIVEEPKQTNPEPKPIEFQNSATNLEQEPPQSVQPELKSPPPTSTIPHLEPSNSNDPNLLPTVSDDPGVTPAENAGLESRAQFEESSEEKSSYFGALVPAKDLPMGLTDPRVKKLYYVGENINLPLKMVQDENGVMKLRVDTDALCNCENKNCTKRHIDERFRSAVSENVEDETALPELQVSYGRDSHKSEDLMDSFVDSLHDHGESSDVFKRSAKIDDGSIDELIREESEKERYMESEKLMLENEIEKLNESIERYNQKTRKLLNKGTVALFKDVQKTKEVDKMVTLANNLLLWMKDLSLKTLQS